MGRFSSVLITLLAIVIVFFLSPIHVLAANCGSATPCACGDTVNESYVLSANIGPCSSDGLTVDTSNIIIDGNGFSITGDGNSGDYGIQTPDDSDLVNVTIKNFGKIGNFERGVYFDRVNNSLIYNNTMNSEIYGNTYAIYLSECNSDIVENNVISWNSSGSGTSNGIHWEDNSENHTIIGNIINIYSVLSGSGIQVFLGNSGNSNSNIIHSNVIDVVTSSDGYGIFLYNFGGSSMNSNAVYSNTITVNSQNMGTGISLGIWWGSSVKYNTIHSNMINVNAPWASGIGLGGMFIPFSNTIFNETINVYSDLPSDSIRVKGISLGNSRSTNVTSCTINSTAPNAQAADISISESNNVIYDSILLGNNWSVYSDSGSNTIVNVSYSGDEYVGSGSKLTRKWYADINVIDSLGDVSGATVIADNGSSVILGTTDSSGMLKMQEITAYINSNGNATVFYPYNISAYKDSRDSIINAIIDWDIDGLGNYVDGTGPMDLGMITITLEDPINQTCQSQGYQCCASCQSGPHPAYDSNCTGSQVCCDECTVPQTCTNQGHICCEACDGTGYSGLDGSCSGSDICCDSCSYQGGDDEPPLRFNGTPIEPQLSGITSVIIGIQTDENAFCKYSTTGGAGYNDPSMTPFSTPFGTAHQVNVSVAEGNNSFYIRCIDGSSNANQGDYLILFSVGDVGDSTPPAVISSSATDPLEGTNISIIQLDTDEPCTCRYSPIGGMSFSDMDFSLETSNGINHSIIVPAVEEGEYNLYVRCQDSVGNANADDVVLSFSVTGAASAMAAYGFQLTIITAVIAIIFIVLLQHKRTKTKR